ncbi:MAG: ATP synthase subunit I [Myxococcota bacterium]
MTDAVGKIAMYIAACGAIISGAVFLVFGAEAGVGAMVGAAVATLNALAMRWMIRKVLGGSSAARTTVMILLGFKMAILGAICYALIAIVKIDAIGFAIGLSALVFGILLGGRAAQDELSEETAEEGAEDALLGRRKPRIAPEDT